MNTFFNNVFLWVKLDLFNLIETFKMYNRLKSLKHSNLNYET